MISCPRFDSMAKDEKGDSGSAASKPRMTRRNISDREHAEALIYAADNLLSRSEDPQSEEIFSARLRLTEAVSRAKADLYPAKQ